MNFFEIMFARSLSGGSGGGGSAPVYQEGFHSTGAKWVDGRDIWYYAKKGTLDPLFTPDDNDFSWGDIFPGDIQLEDILDTCIYGFDASLNTFTNGYKGKSAYFNLNFGISVSNLETDDEVWGLLVFFTVS